MTLALSLVFQCLTFSSGSLHIDLKLVPACSFLISQCDWDNLGRNRQIANFQVECRRTTVHIVLESTVSLSTMSRVHTMSIPGSCPPCPSLGVSSASFATGCSGTMTLWSGMEWNGIRCGIVSRYHLRIQPEDQYTA